MDKVIKDYNFNKSKRFLEIIYENSPKYVDFKTFIKSEPQLRTEFMKYKCIGFFKPDSDPTFFDTVKLEIIRECKLPKFKKISCICGYKCPRLGYKIFLNPNGKLMFCGQSCARDLSRYIKESKIDLGKRRICKDINRIYGPGICNDVVPYKSVLDWIDEQRKLGKMCRTCVNKHVTYYTGDCPYCEKCYSNYL